MKISIIIPCDSNIKNEIDLEPLLISIENQVSISSEQVEIILVYSNLYTKFNFNKYPNVNSMIRLYCGENLTFGELKKLGYSYAQGDYIMFLPYNYIFYYCMAIAELVYQLPDVYTKEYYNLNTIKGYNIKDSNFDLVLTTLTTTGKIYNKNFLDNYINCIANTNFYEDVELCHKILNTGAQYDKINNNIILIELFPIAPSMINNLYEEILNTANAFYNIELENRALALRRLLAISEATYNFIYLNNITKDYQNLIENNLYILITNYNLIYTNLNEIYDYQSAQTFDEDFQSFLHRIINKEC